VEIYSPQTFKLNFQRIIIQKTYRCRRDEKFPKPMLVNEFHDKSLQKKYIKITTRTLNFFSKASSRLCYMVKIVIRTKSKAPTISHSSAGSFGIYDYLFPTVSKSRLTGAQTGGFSESV